MKIKTNQNGFSAIDIILVIVALGAIGAAVYFAVFHKPAPVTKTVTVTKTVPTTTTAANVLKIPELGVQITLPETMSKVSYSYESQSTVPGQYGLSDAALVAQDPSCTSSNSPLGTIWISDTKLGGSHAGIGGSQLLSNGKYLNVIDPSGVVCNDVMDDGGIESTDGLAIINALKTATLITN
jgi:hypothetical protein